MGRWWHHVAHSGRPRRSCDKSSPSTSGAAAANGPAARGRSAALGDSFFCCELSQAGRLVGVIAGETTLRWAVDATQRRRFAPRLSVALPSVKVDASPELRPAPERLSDYV